MNDHDKAELQMRAELAEVRQDIAELRGDIAGLLEAWRTAGGVVKFVKWSAALVAAITTIGVSLSAAKGIVIQGIIGHIK